MKQSVKTVLLVEDNADDEELTRLAFEENALDYRLVVVRDGAEALEYLFGTGRHAARNPGEMPGLILLDLKLPKASGHEVLERIAADERTRCIPVIVMTTSDDESDRVESYRLSADGFIRKPVDFASYVDVVRGIGRSWLTGRTRARP